MASNSATSASNSSDFPDQNRPALTWAAILAVPTAIDGLYGMNFAYMPELRWRYGYFLVVSVILAICAILYRRFTCWKWL